MSLVRRNPRNGRITDNGVIFKLEGTNKKIELTPEICIDTQLDMGSDIIMCLGRLH
jgi:queuine tRNA-ribosyltransferase